MYGDRYSLNRTIELDETFFTSENSLKIKMKAGTDNQRKSKVLVMIESTLIAKGGKRTERKT